MKRAGLQILLFLSGCGQSETDRLQEQNSQLQQQVDNLNQKLTEIKEKSEDLETASNNLQSQLARFQSENWQDVMPDAEAAGSEVEQAQQEIKETTDS